MRFNQSIETYLSHVQHPKLLLCCGHPTAEVYHHNYTLIDDRLIDDGLNLRGEFAHNHEGWYTIDKNEQLNPDLVGDIESEQVITTISTKFKNLVDIVYIEGWIFYSTRLYQMIYDILKSGGLLLCSLGNNKAPQHIEEFKHILYNSGFDIGKLSILHNPLSSIDKHCLRNVIQNLPKVSSINDINNKDIYDKLCELEVKKARIYGKNIIFLYKILYMTGEIPRFLNELKKLSLIDSNLSWGLSYEHNRHDYFIIMK
jgi:SAM-dependent methyltransferase